MDLKYVSKMTVKRLPIYLNYLRTLPADGAQYISATRMAHDLELGDVQVRKDLSAVCGLGKPKVGYSVAALINSLDNYLEVEKTDNVVIVGAGKLGKALLDYDGFSGYGLNILAAFDNNAGVIGTEQAGKPVLSVEDLPKFCKDNDVHIGIITVPAKQAQQVCDLLVQNGIQAIMNFAPVHLKTGDNVLLHNEQIAASLILLSKNLKSKTLKER